MKLLIIYEDECLYNPIVYVGKIRDDIDIDEAITEQVQMAIADANIMPEDTTVEEITHFLMRIDGHCWVDEHYCFSIKQI